MGRPRQAGRLAMAKAGESSIPELMILAITARPTADRSNRSATKRAVWLRSRVCERIGLKTRARPIPIGMRLKLPRFRGRFGGSGQSFMSIFLASNSMGEK